MSQIASLFDNLSNNPAIQWFFTFIFTVGVSTFISWYFGDRWNYSNQRKEKHSKVLKDNALMQWYTQMDNIAWTKVRINRETGLFEAWPQQKLVNTSYGESLVQHLESGYSEILENWKECKREVIRHNELDAQFHNEVLQILKQKGEALGLNVVNSVNGIDDPATYLNPHRFVLGLLDSFPEKNIWKKSWSELQPKQNTGFDEDGVYSVDWGGGRLMRDSNQEKFEQVMAKIEEVFNDEIIFDRYLEIKMDEERVNRRKNEFRVMLDKVIKDIELGSHIKGKCDLCFDSWLSR